MFERENSLSWRGQKREGYTQIVRGHWVKNDDFDYFTEKDLIRETALRHDLKEAEVEDVYNLFMKTLKDLLYNDRDYDKGYYIPYFGYFLKSVVKVEDLTKGKNTVKYIKAKRQLDLYMRGRKSSIKMI